MKINLVLEDFINLSDDLKFKYMTSLSQNYIQSSIIFSLNAKEIESKKFHDEIDTKNHHAYAVGSILFSVFYLEASINEFFISIVENINQTFVKDDATRTELISYWDDEKKIKPSILEKYDQALLIVTGKKRNKGKIPSQYVEKLISLRNYLVHYKTEWIELKGFENEKVTIADLDRELTELSKHCESSMYDNTFFPNKYFCFKFTKLAISNCISFVEEFYSNLGIDDIYKENINIIKNNYNA